MLVSLAALMRYYTVVLIWESSYTSNHDYKWPAPALPGFMNAARIKIRVHPVKNEIETEIESSRSRLYIKSDVARPR
jgi:hypothetical protein